jgi:hypothetical protein
MLPSYKKKFTTIAITYEVHDKLSRRARAGQSFNDILEELLKMNSSTTAERGEEKIRNSSADPSSGPAVLLPAKRDSTPSKLRKEKSMAQIRRLVAEGCSHKDIMEQLKLPRSTYFRYLSEAFEHDWQLLKQENNPDALALQISILINTFKASLRMLNEIINSPKTTVRQKIAASDAKCRTAVAILQLTYQGPLIMNRILKDIDLAWHFKKPFGAGEVDFLYGKSRRRN